jgi:hypothetical protein
MEKNQAELILEMTAISGELPYGQAIRLCNSEHYKRKIITLLKNDNLITTVTKDRLRGYRLTGQAKKSLLTSNPDRFTFYLTGNTDTNKIRGEYSRRYRLHRISEVLVTMSRAGVPLFRDKKPDIFNPDIAVPLPGQAKLFTDSAFYDSREVKDLGEETAKINNSRFTGVFLTQTDIFIVYNTANAVMKWNHKSELRAKALITAYLCHDKIPGLYAKKEIKAIVTGNGMETAYTLLTSGGRSRKNFFIIDGTFNSFHYIPNDETGEMLIKILKDDNVRYSLDLTLKKDLTAPINRFNIESDGLDADGNLVLFAYDMDLPRIVRFNASLNMRNMKGVIICFDFQRDVLARYCGDTISFQTIIRDKFERRFLTLT